MGQITVSSGREVSAVLFTVLPIFAIELIVIVFFSLLQNSIKLLTLVKGGINRSELFKKLTGQYTLYATI